MLVVSFCALLFLTQDALPAIWNTVRSLFGDAVVMYIPAAFMGSSMAFLLLYIVFIKKKRNFSNYIWYLIVLTVLYVAYMGIDNPYEKMHLFEYFLLSLFAFRLFHHYIFSYKLYFINAIFTIAIALLDEGSQLFTVHRTFSFADLGADFTAAVLGQLSIALIIAPKLQVWRLRIKSKYKHYYAQEKWLNRR